VLDLFGLNSAPQRSTEPPVLYLDVDGVLNPWLARSAPSSWKRHWRTVTSPHSGMQVWVNWAQAAELVALGVEIVWATTWVNDPVDLEWLAGECGLPAGLERISFDPDVDTDNCGKRPGIMAHLGESRRPVVWIDDDLGPQDLAWVEWRNLGGATTLAVQPSAHTGVSYADVAKIRNFLARQTS
jgi:hypothetical protein